MLPGTLFLLAVLLSGLAAWWRWGGRADAPGEARQDPRAERWASERDALFRAQESFLAAAARELRREALLALQTMEARELDPAGLRRQLAGVEQQSDRVARLIDELLDVSRYPPGPLPADRSGGAAAGADGTAGAA